MKKVAFKILGCKVNTFETESMWELFKEKGYKRVSLNNLADVYVINTCSVTNVADKKSRQSIRQCIRKNPNALIVVTGCYSQLASEKTSEIDGVDIILGTKDRDKILDYISEYEKNKKQIIHVDNIMKETEFENLKIVNFESKTRAFLKIQDGCNNFCSYCIIPWARGLIRSQKPEKILYQIEELVKNDINEIILTGIHTGSYGDDFDKYSFIDLLKDIDNIDGLKRVRISSIEISQLTDQVIEFIKKSTKFVNHLHIPIQAASNEILSSMKRKYTIEEYIDKIKYIKNEITDIAISTDIIVGYPGETDEIFNKSLNNILQLNFSDMHIFPFSKREGTPAAKMNMQISSEVKKQRVHILENIRDEMKLNYSKKFINKEVSVLFEKKNKDGLYEGYSKNYLKVVLESNDDIKNTIKTVVIKKCNSKVNTGEIVS